MKSNANLGSATRTVGKLCLALLLLLVAVAAGFGGTALIVYRQLDGGTAPAARNQAERRTVRPTREQVPDSGREDAKPRQVAALSSDLPRYTYADNNGGQPSAPAKRERPAANVPAALENVAPPMDVVNSGAKLNDPESRYIVDSRTGRVIGIDGSAGARREEEEEQRRLQSAPRAVAVQTPAPEVRVASAVVEDGQPVYRDGQPASVSGSNSQYLPVRRALPVAASAEAPASNFNVGEYLASGEPRPVLRAQPVAPGGARVSRAARVYRLSDGSQTVVVN